MFTRKYDFSRSSTIPAVFEKHECDYTQLATLLYDAHTGMSDIPEKERNEKIREIFCDICGVSPDATMPEFRKAVRRHQVDLFEIIEEVLPKLIITGWDSDPFFMEYVEVKNLALGDTNSFVTEDDTTLIVNRLSGGHWDIKRQRLGRGQEYSVETEWYGLGIYAEFERLLAGYENWSAFINKISEAFTVYINNKLFAATMGAISNLPNAARFHKTLSFAAADASRDSIMELTEDIQLFTGQDVAILGTMPALAKLRRLEDVNWISAEAKTELFRTGRLGTFMGIRLIELRQALDPKTYNRMVNPSADTLLFMPTGSNNNNKFIKLVYEGDARILHVQDETTLQDMTYEYKYQQKLGLSTVFGYQFGVVTITP